MILLNDWIGNDHRQSSQLGQAEQELSVAAAPRRTAGIRSPQRVI